MFLYPQVFGYDESLCSFISFWFLFSTNILWKWKWLHNLPFNAHSLIYFIFYMFFWILMFFCPSFCFLYVFLDPRVFLSLNHESFFSFTSFCFLYHEYFCSSTSFWFLQICYILILPAFATFYYFTNAISIYKLNGIHLVVYN